MFFDAEGFITVIYATGEHDALMRKFTMSIASTICLS
jgi:hypothetical protein